MTAAKRACVTEANFSRAETMEFWRTLNPHLTITDAPFSYPTEEYPLSSDEMAAHILQYKKEGYLQTPVVIPEIQVARMASCIETLVQNGFLPVFAFVYDEFWRLYRSLSSVLQPIFGEDYKLTLNIWAWYIPPNDISAGFKPHRDFVGMDTLNDNGLPKMGTVWIPLTDVDTLNSCMYILPTNMDPCVPYNLNEHNVSYGDLQNIRALPAKAGSVLSWSTRALHWGSRSSEFSKQPRISIASYIETKDETRFDSLPLDASLYLPLNYRLAIIGQVINHYNEEPLSYDRFPKTLLQFLEKYSTFLPEIKNLKNVIATEHSPGQAASLF